MLPLLAEEMVTYLQSLPQENWGTLKPGPLLPIVNALDPDEIIKCTSRKIFIIPVRPDYNLDESLKRGNRVRQLIVEYTISTIVLIPFDTIKRGDVTDWPEVKDVWELREMVTENLIRGDFGLNLIRVESESPIETELNNRNFLAIVDFIYQKATCGAT